MDEKEITAVAASLEKWNPLGENAVKILDLDGYRTEAIDIISTLSMYSEDLTTAQFVSALLQQAFELPIDEAAVKGVAKDIELILKIVS